MVVWLFALRAQSERSAPARRVALRAVRRVHAIVPLHIAVVVAAPRRRHRATGGVRPIVIIDQAGIGASGCRGAQLDAVGLQTLFWGEWQPPRHMTIVKVKAAEFEQRKF